MKIRKYKLFFDEAKEEKWINEMSAQGWQLINYHTFYYAFEKGQPGEYTYRCDILDNFGFGKQGKEYIEFVESTGAELVKKKLQWVYFKQHRDLGPFELYTDDDSKLQYINRIWALYLTVVIINIMSALMNGGLTILDIGLEMNKFFFGVSTGILVVFIIPFIKLWHRRKTLIGSIKQLQV